MKNWYLVIVSLIGLHGVYAGDEQIFAQAQVEIEVGPDDDDYYDDDESPQVWIGPGLYYGVWFDHEHDYNDWCRRNYDHRHGYEDDDHGDRGRDDREQGHGRGHGGGGGHHH